MLDTALPTLSIEVSDFDYDMRKDGWKLKKDVPLGGGRLDFCLAAFLRKDEPSVSGNTMLSRTRKFGKFAGQHHAEYLLKHQDLIPESWHNYLLVFPGTEWRLSVGRRYVSCLEWDGGHWCLYWAWLGYEWRGNDRVVLLRK